MSIIQPNLVVPQKFQSMIDAGELWRDGGVLRWVVNGRIAHILKDSPVLKTDTPNLQTATEVVKKINIANFLKNHKGAVAVGVIGLVLTVGTGIYLYVDKKKSNRVEAEITRRACELQAALSNYLRLATCGSLKVDDIDRLIAALDELDRNDIGEKIVIDFSAEDMSILVRCIIEHTSTLAIANSYLLDNSCADSDEECTAINLRRHLNIQKNIFENVA